MRRILILRRTTMNRNAWSYAIGAIACAATVGLVAQTATPQRSGPSSGSARRFVVIGCISEPAGSTAENRGATTGTRFIITDTRAAAASVYGLDGDQSQLAIHVGHTLEIAGSVSAGSDTGRGNANAPVLRVESLTYISKSCQKFDSGSK
jgi:hypothetical protein